MLTFLNSVVLIGLTAISIPILIHLFTRKKIKTVNFSSLKFLKELQQQKIRRLKFRQILLFILRTLLILTLVLAFARPALKTTESSTLESGAQITAIIILDNTLSMGREIEGRRLLDVAKQKALQVVNLMRPNDEIYLLYCQDPPKFAHQGPRYSLESVRKLIDNTELSYRGTDYVASLGLANEILNKSNNINQEVYLICDMQRNGLRLAGIDNGGKVLSENVRLFVLPITAEETDNLNILSVRLGNQILEKGKVVEIESVVRNNGQKAIKDKLVHLFVNGKRVGQSAVSLEPNSAAKVVFRMVPDQTGPQSGFVLLEDDDLAEDNRRYFTFSISNEIAVLIVGKQKEDTYYLNVALHPEEGVASFIKIKEILYKELLQQKLEDYQVVIFSNVPKLENAAALKLQSFVAAGGGLMVFLGADVDLRNYNEIFHKKLNLPLLTQSVRKTYENEFLSFGRIDFSHPIFRGVFEGEKKVESPHIRFALNITSENPLDKIIEFSNGAPFLFESRYRKGRIMYVTTSLSRDWSDLVLRGVFVPLINRCVTYLADASSEGEDEIGVGEEITYYPESKYSSSKMTIERPDGTRLKVKPEVSKGKYFLRFTTTDEPGIYKLRDDAKLVEQWAVNYSLVESEISTFEIADLEKLVAGAQIYEIKDTEEIAEKLKESRFGQELWKYLMATALALLLLEMLIFREKRELNKES
ncbi:MAG: BatA domain-containing protein [bacterium]